MVLLLKLNLDLKSLNLEPSTHIDNEYTRAGILDPKILITTSRDPSSKLLQFSKEMRLVFPNSHRINRGNYVVKELAEACRANEITDLIVLHEHRGTPGALRSIPFRCGLELTFHRLVPVPSCPDGRMKSQTR